MRVVGVHGDVPGRDQWLVVTEAVRRGGEDLPELTATSILDIDAPEGAYE